MNHHELRLIKRTVQPSIDHERAFEVYKALIANCYLETLREGVTIDLVQVAKNLADEFWDQNDG